MVEKLRKNEESHHGDDRRQLSFLLPEDTPDGMTSAEVKVRGADEGGPPTDITGSLLKEQNSDDVSELDNSASRSEISSQFPGLSVHQNYEPGSQKARLVSLLNECLVERRFPRSHNRLLINRAHFARLLMVTGPAVLRYNNIFSSYDEVLELVEPLGLPDAAADNLGIPHGPEKDSQPSVHEVIARFPELAEHQEYEPGSTRALLVHLLNGFVLTEEFPETSTARREYLAERLQLSPTYLWVYQDIFAAYNAIFPKLNRTASDDTADEVVNRFPSLAVQQNYAEGTLGAKLVVLLNDCVIAGHFPRSSKNKMQISRAHFADLLGVSQANLQRAKAVFTSYDAIVAEVEPLEAVLFGTAQIGGAVTVQGPDSDRMAHEVSSRFPELAVHQNHGSESVPGQVVRLLNQYLVTGEIPVGQKGRIDRQQLASRLQTSVKNIREHKDLLEAYDAILPRLGSRDHVAEEVLTRFPNLAAHQYHPADTTKAKLVKMLNDCVVAGKVPRSTDVMTISRKYFASQLNVAPSAMLSYRDIFVSYEAILEDVEPSENIERPAFGADTEAAVPMDESALKVVSRYPELLKHQHYPVGHTARKIVQLLNSQLCGSGLVRGRGGKIDRRVFRDALEVTKSALTFYLQLFTDYEDAVGIKEARVELLIPAIRKWLQEAFADGSLQLWDSKVSRVQLSEQFGLPKTKTNLIRYPRLGELVEEFDAKIVSSGYQPREVVRKATELEAFLRSSPPVDKSGRFINKAEIKRALGIANHQIDQPPYSLIIAKAQQRLSLAIENDPLISSVGGRTFRFTSLVEDGWPSSYITRVAENFERIYRAKTKHVVKSHHGLLLELLSFLASNGSQFCRSVFYGLGNQVPVASLTSEFTRALQEYREFVRERNDHDVVCNHKLTSTNSLLRLFSAASVFPTPNLYLKGFLVREKAHLKSVAEATEAKTPKHSGPNVDDYILFATSLLQQAADLREIDLVATETGDFNKVLREELAVGDFGAADNPASVILRVLERRISLIKAAAWAIVEEGQRRLEIGKSLLARATDIDDDFDRIVDRGGLSRPERDAILRRYFPIGGDKDQGIANLLKVVQSRYNSLYPAAGNGDPERRFFTGRAQEYGGSPLLQSYLIPSQEVAAAVLTLYLLESGSNISVGRTLYADCIESAEEPHHCKVTGYKARAAGKPIFAVMGERCEAVLSMRWLKSAFEEIPGIDKDAQNQMFICRGSRARTIAMIGGDSYRDEFKRLIQSIPDLAHLSMTPNMIRPSILLRAALESDAGTTVSQAIGQHGNRVHEGYVNKYPLRYLRDSEIRHFQHSLETVVIQAMEEAHALLGVDLDGMARRVESVMKTGLGTLCANRNGRPGNDGAACTSLDCWNDCPQLLVIAKKEEVAILQVWQHSLRLVEGDWIQNQPERWEAVWLPWLCFIDAVEVKLRQSYGNVWRSASAISEKMIANPAFEPMRLF